MELIDKIENDLYKITEGENIHDNIQIFVGYINNSDYEVRSYTNEEFAKLIVELIKSEENEQPIF